MTVDVVKLQILLGKKEWNYKTLAEISKISKQTLSCINARKSCTPIVACKIAKAFGIDVTEILQN